ncbi:uncharacterized protein [Primulina huaijiensis]|uniref:uncharacterized protein n=1 Tax=Primulina huaijiensis TaxID=1492673 RepID=UPI003CC6FC66
MLSNYCNLMNFNPPIIFPPINHENLHISSDPSLIPEQIPQIHASVDQQYAYSNSDSDSDSDSDSIANSESYSTFSPSNSTPILHSPLFASPKTKPAVIYSDSWTRILHTKVGGIMRFIWGLSRGLWWTFRSATIAAALIAFLYFRQRRRLRAVESSKARLLGIIEEKDEKINQLLHQISRMNQVLMTAAAAARLGFGTSSGS